MLGVQPSRSRTGQCTVQHMSISTVCTHSQYAGICPLLSSRSRTGQCTVQHMAISTAHMHTQHTHGTCHTCPHRRLISHSSSLHPHMALSMERLHCVHAHTAHTWHMPPSASHLSLILPGPTHGAVQRWHSTCPLTISQSGGAWAAHHAP